MASFKLTPAAKEDLKDIARYTQLKWGIKQRNLYLSDIDKRMAWLAENPQLGKSRDDIKPHYLSFPEGQHVIFYREVKGNVEILGILHQSMDFKKHF